MKINEIDRTSTFAWSHDCLPLLATGTVAGAVDLDFNSSSSLELWDIFSATNSQDPIFKATVDNRFYALAWSKPFDGRAKGLLAGAFENGVIEFWDVDTLIKTKDLQKASVHKGEKHTGPVKSLAFNPNQSHVMVSGGSKGEIYIWDTKTFSEPTIPGKAMTPMDEVSGTSWNNSVPHIFASTGNGGYTSIWDLKSKREVLHLSYNGDLGRANFSCVAWHPTQSTKLITASENDGCPLLLTWDLRNSNAPEKIMQGHKKGILSLDWCLQDPELLISSGKDNTTMLWNPITGQRLGEYPTTANWAFLTRFAPSAPDIFATASFDGKITIQSLQDTSPPATTKVIKNDDEFWSEISTTDTQQPKFDVCQAPSWLKRPSSVSFGFGSKLVSVSKDSEGNSLIKINKFVTKSSLQGSSNNVNKAMETNDFNDIINENVDKSSDPTDKSDWELLKKLSEGDKKSLFSEAIKDEEFDSSLEQKPDSNGDAKKEVSDSDKKPEEAGDSFFDKLSDEKLESSNTTASYVPSGAFKLFSSSSSDADKKLIKLVLSNKLDLAVDECLNSGKLVEALVLALDGSANLKEKVKDSFFNKEKDSELARVLYNVSSKNITDIVGNANVDDWKHIANSISSFCTDPSEFNEKITELGDRILASSSDKRDDAILCYFAGGALDKIASIWLKELPAFEKKLLTSSDNKDITSPSDARFETLNNFAEKIAVYRSISNISGNLNGPSIEPTCKALLEYSNLLAGYGQFELADKFLKLLPDDFAGSKTDKERITKASTPVNGGATVAKSATRTATKANAYSRASQPNVLPAQKPVNPMVSPINQFNQPNVGGVIPPVNSRVPAAAPSNPYMKPANPAPAPAAAAAAAHNPYFAHNPYMKPTPSVMSPPGAALSPPPTGPSKPAYKEVTDGWNDLPEAFKQKSAPPRRAAASANSPAATPFPNHPPAGPPKRGSTASPVIPAAGVPPTGPPKGPSRTPSKASLSAVSSPRPAAAQMNGRYAPPPGAAVAPAPPVASAPPVGTPSVPPKNPYAPAGPGTPSSMPASNPYAPPAPVPGPAVTPSAMPPMTPNSMTSAVNNPYAPPPSQAFPPGPGAGPGIVSPRANNIQPAKNPYAPPPGAAAPPPVGGIPPPMRSRVSSGGLVPPPKASIQTPPPPMTSGASITPPPMGPTLSQPPAQAPVAPPAAPVPEKFPPGDRSHISAEALPIYETFSSVYEALKPNIPERYAKHGEDMEKRLNILYDHLNNDDLLSANGIASLKEIATALAAKDYQTASSGVLAFASNHPEEIGNWHAGVKRLVNMAEAIQ